MNEERLFEEIVPDDAGPIVVEVPHAGLVVDAASARFTKIPPEAVAREALLADSDLGADLLWEGSEVYGIARVVARVSRYVVDLNTEPRLPTPYEEKMPPELRVVVRQSQCGIRWRDSALPRVELERRIRDVFEPYHASIQAQLQRARARHGAALLVGSHTFPDANAEIADVVLGTRDGASASHSLRDEFAEVARAHGFSVAVEAPFRGGFATIRHARPDEGVSVIQVELAKRLVCASKGERSNLDIDSDEVRKVRAMLLEAAAAARKRLG